MIANAADTTKLMTALEELDLDLDELGQLFGVENDQARLALERFEPGNAGRDRRHPRPGWVR